MQTVTWQDGKPAPYLLIARAFAAMEGTTKRLKKDEIMVDAYRSILQRCPGVVLFYTALQAPTCILKTVRRLWQWDSGIVGRYPRIIQPASYCTCQCSQAKSRVLIGGMQESTS